MSAPWQPVNNGSVMVSWGVARDAGCKWVWAEAKDGRTRRFASHTSALRLAKALNAQEGNADA